MKKYKVVLKADHRAKPDQIVDGCVGNIFDNGKVATYERGEALKKARIFGGKIEEVKGIHNVLVNLSVVSIPENALLDGVVKLLEGREAFTDTDDELDEKMYAGHVFEDILGEVTEGNKISDYPAYRKIVNQLEELAELVSQDYVLITKV